MVREERVKCEREKKNARDSVTRIKVFARHRPENRTTNMSKLNSKLKKYIYSKIIINCAK